MLACLVLLNTDKGFVADGVVVLWVDLDDGVLTVVEEPLNRKSNNNSTICKKLNKNVSGLDWNGHLYCELVMTSEIQQILIQAMINQTLCRHWGLISPAPLTHLAVALPTAYG